MRSLRLAAVLVLVVSVAASCRLPENALDGPLAVPLRISTTADSIEIDAPAWYAAETAVYVCASDPPSLPESGPARDGWTPGGRCHDFGRMAAPNGLQAELRLDSLTEDELGVFEAAPDWYVLLLKMEADRPTAAIKSTFASPIRPVN